VSNEMISLAKRVLGFYNVKSDAVRVIQSGGIKTVWKIGTAKENYCLKRLKSKLDKALFSITAQDYMSSRGAKINCSYYTIG